jgi:hypothetical protein
MKIRSPWGIDSSNPPHRCGAEGRAGVAGPGWPGRNPPTRLGTAPTPPRPPRPACHRARRANPVADMVTALAVAKHGDSE